MGAPNFELNPLPRAIKTYSLRIAILSILAVAILGGGLAWAEDDEYGSRAPFPAGPLRQIDDVLKPYGIRPSFTYSGDVLGNASGGIRRGVVYEGHVDFGIEADLEKLFGWSGAKLYGNVVNNHGDGLSREYIGNLMTVSSIEALNHTRLYELWIEQAVGKNVSLRFGQFGADAEFNNSKYASGFLNSTFGWPALSSITLPAGGPAFPLTALGVRAKATLSDQLTLLFAMFDGNAAGPGADDPQNLDPHGLNFRLRDSPLLMAEMQYTYRLDASRPGTLKLGGWLHTGNFSDARFDINGLSLADPASNGMPLQHRGAAAPYAVLEQMLVPFDAKGATGIAAFGRLQATQSDRSAVDFYADCGVNVSGFSSARPNDVISVGFGYAGVSSAARGFDQDALSFGAPTTIRSYEAVLETTYSAQIARGWTVLPDFQYIMHPGGGATDPNLPSGQRIPNALVLGMRMTVQWGARDPNSLQ
ncbi:MAG TPA: carbohydrate porin [Pseudolabrys sp.]|jgi:porin